LATLCVVYIFKRNVVCKVKVKRGLFRSMGHMIRCNMCECVVNVFARAYRGYVYLREAWIEGPGMRWETDSTRNERGLETERRIGCVSERWP